MKGKKYIEKNGLLILVIVFLLLLNFTLGYLMLRQSSSALISLIQNRMLDISNTAASMLDGDSLSRLTAEDAGSREYQETLDILTYFQENIELQYIYCIQEVEEGKFAFSVDPTVVDPGEFGSPIVYTDALYKASKGAAAVDEQPYSDEWGSFYSAYSPVFTSSGEVGAIVAVDFSADWYDRQVAHLVITIVAVSAVSLLIGILIVAIISRRNRKKYRIVYGQLNELAGKIEELVHEIESGSIISAQEKETIQNAVESSRTEEDFDALGRKILSMQDQIRNHIELIHEQAYRDGLTGFGNKTAYMDTVRHLELMIRQKIAVFAVAVFDLNGLKTINDNYGHECGDLAIIDTAGILIKIFGKDQLYRIGGDEFIAILKESSQREMKLLFNRLDDELIEANQKERSYVVPLAVSKGFAVYDPETDTEYLEVFKRADIAMYDDKRAYYSRYGDRRR